MVFDIEIDGRSRRRFGSQRVRIFERGEEKEPKLVYYITFLMSTLCLIMNQGKERGEVPIGNFLPLQRHR